MITRPDAIWAVSTTITSDQFVLHRGGIQGGYRGEATNLRWIDNFHTSYVVDCFKHYEKHGRRPFSRNAENGPRLLEEHVFPARQKA